MDLSAVIFVAVAVAWAVYLVPKALHHHDEATRVRSVDRFSHTVRVLARREAVSSREARLVVNAAPRGAAAPATHDDPAVEAQVAAFAAPTAAQLRARRLAARRATGRRRRVLLALATGNLAVVALASVGLVAWGWLAVPAGLLASWLVLCRVMVRGELAAWEALTRPAPVDKAEEEDDEDGVPEDYSVEANEQGFAEVAPAAETSAFEVASSARALWDPVPVTLPTYVGKPAAVRRSVRTIDLDATGVWTAGRSDEDAIIAQQAAQRAAHSAAERVAGDEDGPRAVGS